MLLFKLMGFCWLLPVTLLFWVFYLLPLWYRDFRFRGWVGFGVARFELQSQHSWYAKLWRDWAGFAGPCCILHRRGLTGRQLTRTLQHEYRHCMQQLLFGPLFYPVYALCSVAIWVYSSAVDDDYHAYLDNPFERDARRAAGQPVYIPRRLWPQGRKDRWPWW